MDRMNGGDLRDVYRAYLACLNERRWDDLRQFVADDVSYNGELVGLSGYRSMLEADTRAIPDLRYVPEILLADARIVACRLFFECTPQQEFLGFEPTGARIAFAEHVFYRFTDRRIADVWSLIDIENVREQVSRRTDRASRIIAAPLTRVFSALVDPDALLEWLPPRGMRGEFERFDGRAGGSYRLRLTYLEAPEAGGKSGADSDVVEARFLDIAPDDRVVQEVAFESDDPRFAGTMTMTWSVTAVDAGTRVDFRADGVPPGISAEDHAEGMDSSLANLAACVETRR
uniref:Activator of Hsp90 ATPase homologue 1/2-like C-terminal domain-containing protein n=1 Tax=Mycobacterium sp. (strain JLS) TaxID=164757 RepID=A0A5Q5CKT1_MYCSJ